MTDQKTKKATSPTVITITLPESEEEPRSGTLIVARGELAHIRQFTYANLSDLTAILKQGVVALAAIEADPPKDTSKSLPPATNTQKPEVKSEGRRADRRCTAQERQPGGQNQLPQDRRR